MSSLSTNTYSQNSNSTAPNSRAKELTPVRVLDVILDESHPEYDKYGRNKCIGGIKYAPVDRRVDTSDTTTLPIAYPLNASIRVLPLVNEIVLISHAPDEKVVTGIENSKLGSLNSTSTQAYYSTIVSVWNHPHHNAAPDQKETKKGLGNDFKELTDINPLTPYPGDILVEGRHGQSIRFSGAKHYKNSFTDQSNDGDPFTLISNGQKQVGNGDDLIEENINEDDSSIYLLSNQTAPLKQARDKTKAWKKPPIKADTYKGSQVMINGGRLYFNSKEESTLFSTKEAFGVSSKTVNLDAKDYIALDAEKIYLGEKALVEEFEPVILGESMEGFLYTLLFNLQALADDLIVAGTDGVNVQNLITRGKLMNASLKGLQNQINPGGKSQLKSRKVYTE